MRKLIIALILISALIVSGIAGCGDSVESSISTSDTSVSDNTLISDDFDDLSADLSGINLNDSDQGVTPISSADLAD